MLTFWNGGGGSGGVGSLSIIPLLDKQANTTFDVPAGYIIVSILARKLNNVGLYTVISVGETAPDYDDYVPAQNATDNTHNNAVKTIVVNECISFVSQVTLTIASKSWETPYDFYVTIQRVV